MKSGRHCKASARRRRPAALIAAAAVLIALAAGTTIAYLTDITQPVENLFRPSKVTCYVEESFDGTTKNGVKIQNTGTVDAYIRVAVAANYVNGDGAVCAAHIPADMPAPGTGWVKSGGCYYYTDPVAPGAYTGELFSGLAFPAQADGCQMKLEIIASAIQSSPVGAVQSAWGVDPSALG